ncbi:tetrapyrrole methylase [Obelidium mucronatum]|nr:tetrapyrrole methylase [Obelidium mucronatum]
MENTNTTSPGLLVSLRLSGKHVLVIGGNKEALSRVGHAFDAAAIVTVLAPSNTLCDGLREKYVGPGLVKHIDAAFEGVEDLYMDMDELDENDNPRTYHCVLGCLDEHADSLRIAECSRALRIPVNCADVPDLCDFYFVAVFKEGLVQVGVSTNGGGPRLAARLRTHIKDTLPARTGEAVAKIAHLRTRIKTAPAPPGVSIVSLVKKRMQWMSRLCDAWTFEQMAEMEEEDVLRLIGAYERGEQQPPVQIIKDPVGVSVSTVWFFGSLWFNILLYPVRVSFSLLSAAFPGLKTWTPPAISPNLPKKDAVEAIQIPKLEIDLISSGSTPVVVLVGAGPGNPNLLTLAALKQIHAADTIVTDTLVSPQILSLIPKHIPIVYVPKKEKGKSDAVQDLANEMCMTAITQQNRKRVVRLKGGDPFLFGRGGEELLFFRERGVHVEVVVGVSSVNGVLGSVGIPATFKGLSDSVLVLTARGENGAWPDVPSWGSGMRTTVIFMPIARMKGLSDLMISRGYPSDLPAAVIEKGTCQDQRVIKGTLSDIHEKIVTAAVISPALLVVGGVCSVLSEK